MEETIQLVPQPAGPEEVSVEEIRHLEEGLEQNTAQVAKLRAIRQSAIRRVILFALMICALGWVLFQTYSVMGADWLRANLGTVATRAMTASQAMVEHLEAMMSLLTFLVVLSIFFGAMLLGLITAVSHALTARSLIRRQETAIASARVTLREVLEGSTVG